MDVSNHSEVPRVMHTKFPARVMDLGVVCNGKYLLPLHYFQQGHRVNDSEYVKVLDKVVKPKNDNVCDRKSYAFQQDFAPSVIAQMTQK